ncbi:adenylosuccinate lyase [Anoxynatronum buryatiense]|uniref:Adenylosuccinate lyase n=1 Tax=Anoxynatronum buryatiense TaxID=489973 RepID=A0AA45WUM3_9CLOT|nr:adenylosuccinate lyase [Anoxynatronum buryatiense]SMP47850.1 adenylosuccinate lyase [Anoxynatronum buryatiense]
MKIEKPNYENPLVERYASREMLTVFSADNKFRTWRKLWIALAKAEQSLGLPIDDEQIIEMEMHQDNINYEIAKEKEKEIRHDVMAHVFAFGQQCPKAMPIIHLGATSAYVGDNTDLIQIKEALMVLSEKMLRLMDAMSRFCLQYKNLPTLGFTHFQPAQLTTVGKRGCLWLYDLLMDFENLQHQLHRLKFRGVKGTTGTQASFLKLFEGDHERVELLDKKVAEIMGFNDRIPVTGQTYTRKIDFEVLSVLSGIAQSLHKTTNDLRLLQHLKEIEEPFEAGQVGSSAMAYKRNPMRSERIASLCRWVIALQQNAAMTQATQWFERTLDDSANRRLTIPESFLAIDAVLDIALNVFSGLVVYEKMIGTHIDLELPFMATENIMMAAVKRGGDRQQLHEQIRLHSMKAAERVKMEGKSNDLIQRISEDPLFGLTQDDLAHILEAEQYVGRAPEQTSKFIETEILPILQKYPWTPASSDLNV